MDTETHTISFTAQSDQRLSIVLRELSKIRNEVEKTKDWYKKHSQRPMILFRTFGVRLTALTPL